MLIGEYFHLVEETVSACPAVISREISYDERTHFIGLIKGVLTFRDGSELHFKEFIQTGDEFVKYKYAYHYQRGDRLVFRYDNHHIKLNAMPLHHKHHLSEDHIIESIVPDLEHVLNEILILLPA